MRPAFVLAGGRSSRMGRDKAGLPWQGGTLLAHALNLLRTAGFSPAVAGLRQPFDCGCLVVADHFEDAGPLGGIEAVLRSTAKSYTGPVLFLAVDLPAMQPELLHLLWERAAATDALATIPSLAGQPQPLCAVYHTELAEGIAGALRDDDRKVMRVIERLSPPPRFDTFRVEAVAAAQGWQNAHTWFANLNTPTDLAQHTRDFRVADTPVSI